ncbi:MAG: O-linked N-acetylglucosamine transferase, SPINDLY family protein [Elainella sp. Prado103]|jgi:predicted O-linked N-acetylglucosamine transferase (SPINDLY family)|nr:O-linked N-acetylglucosamine transferase, SPINDLY family protein [Elainella sp. Prado103]
MTPSSPDRSDLQLAQSQMTDQNYTLAIEGYEQILAADPQCWEAYWQLGLAYLLHGQETEAQFTWMTPFTEVAGEPQAEAQMAAWTADLLKCLDAAAQAQSDRQQWETAWLIRQHIRQLVPAEWTLEGMKNLLPLVSLHWLTQPFDPSILKDWGIVTQMQSLSPIELTAIRTAILTLLSQLWDKMPDHPAAIDYTAVSLPVLSTLTATEQQDWIDRLLSLGNYWATVQGRYDLACQYGELCLQIWPNQPDVIGSLSRWYQDSGQYELGLMMAEQYDRCMADSIAQLPDKILSAALLVRANLRMAGRWNAAVGALDQLTERLNQWLAAPNIGDDTLLSPLLLCSTMFSYPYFSDTPIRTRHLQNRLAQVYADNLKRFTQKHIKNYSLNYSLRVSDRSKLRIGYICHCFRRHSVGWLCRWVFEHFDRSQFEVYAYFVMETQLSSFGERWFAQNATQSRLCGADALEIARLIQQDGIDILIDLDSLTMDVTCQVMALKPAPIQATWLGLDASGIPTIDYFIADPYVLPENAQEYYQETIWRLPQTYIAVDGFEVGVPNLKRRDLDIPDDAIVYFSAQTGQKRNPGNIRLQMQILKQVPNSYFLIKGLGSETAMQKMFLQIAEAEGVTGDRLRFLPPTANEETHRANLSLADVVLDTFPYNGATTTLETLWMGIPIITQVGQQFAARNSYTMLINVGITAGIAWNDPEYVAWGVRFGIDATLRDQIAWQLQKSRQTAPLWNARQLTRQLEQAYRTWSQQFASFISNG